jgi:hypothetical protein
LLLVRQAASFSTGRKRHKVWQKNERSRNRN